LNVGVGDIEQFAQRSGFRYGHVMDLEGSANQNQIPTYNQASKVYGNQVDIGQSKKHSAHKYFIGHRVQKATQF